MIDIKKKILIPILLILLIALAIVGFILYKTNFNKPKNTTSPAPTPEIAKEPEEAEPPKNYITEERKLFNNEPITAANRCSDSGVVILTAAGKSVATSFTGNDFRWWTTVVCTPNESGTYKITDLQTEEKDAQIVPENGFVLAFYGNNAYQAEQINLDNNEVIINFAHGSLENLRAASENDYNQETNKYPGMTNKQARIGTLTLISRKQVEETLAEELNLPSGEDDIFYEYYDEAEKQLAKMTYAERIAQMFVVGSMNNTDYSNLTQYKFGGYLFFKPYFVGRNADTTASRIQSLQDQLVAAGGLPAMTTIDEEGSTVSRLNNTPNVYTNFRNPSVIYNQGGLEAIAQDTITKSQLLKRLGINVNFAPVLDICNSGSFIYSRTLKQNAEITAQYAKTVIENSKAEGVTFATKHFPGYGNAIDTHDYFATDSRPLSDYEEKDLVPFKAGIDAGGEMIMTTHILVTCLDSQYPVSVSRYAHDYLRNKLGFSGLIITDAVNMGAISKTYTTKNSIKNAILAGNDLICISMGETSIDQCPDVNGEYATVTYSSLINYVQEMIDSGEISKEQINTAVRRIIAWKYAHGLIQPEEPAQEVPEQVDETITEQTEN